MTRDEIFGAILAERQRQQSIVTPECDKANTKNDWVAYISAYAGRSTGRWARNERDGQTFRDNMVAVAALAVAALENQA